MRKREDILEVVGTRRCEIMVKKVGRANGPGESSRKID